MALCECNKYQITSVLLPYLHTLFNRSSTLGYIPDDWSIEEVTPLHKKGDKSNVIIIEAQLF